MVAHPRRARPFHGPVQGTIRAYTHPSSQWLGQGIRAWKQSHEWSMAHLDVGNVPKMRLDGDNLVHEL